MNTDNRELREALAAMETLRAQFSEWARRDFPTCGNRITRMQRRILDARAVETACSIAIAALSLPETAEGREIGPCTQAEIDAFEGLDPKSKQLFQLWVERALKAEAALALSSADSRGDIDVEPGSSERIRANITSALSSTESK